MSKKRERHILVAVMGKTPQIVTETLYALLVKSKPRAPISDVYIITTSEGASAAWRALGGEQGAIVQLCLEYGIDSASVRFTKEHIKTICREDNTELDDIRTSGDNILLASQLFGVVKELAQDENSTLYCSIAGGRKTMSSFMMLALTLYGRNQDKLSHVLVSEEVESSPEFFFPTKRNEPIVGRKGNKSIVVNAKDARVELADIPFIRLRDFLGAQFEKLESNIGELIGIAQEQVDLIQLTGEKLVLDLPKRKATYGGKTVPVSGKLLALLAYYADRKVNHCGKPELPICGDCRECFEMAREINRNRFAELFKFISTRTFDNFKADESLSSDAVMTNHTNINKKLQVTAKELDVSSPALKIDADRLWGNTRYGLVLDKNRIEVISIESEKK